MRNPACEFCERTLVETGRMISFRGEDICDECFAQRIGDYSKIESMTVHEIVSMEEAKELGYIPAPSSPKERESGE